MATFPAQDQTNWRQPLFDWLSVGMNSDGTLKGIIPDTNVDEYGASGSYLATTGSVTSGLNSLTVASAIDFEVGQGIEIAGAGAAGVPLVSSISGINGTLITLASNASTTVTGAAVDHEDTVAVQAAFNAADTDPKHPVYFPGIHYRVNTINYRNQMVIGAGIQNTQIIGKPGKDVFHGDPTVAATSRANGGFANLTINVNDSVDASGLFPQRGGVGNAGIAYDFPDGAATAPLRFSQMRMDKLLIRSTSFTAANKTCGVYTQGGGNNNQFGNIQIWRLWYGWWGDWPTSNLTSTEHAFDHSSWRDFYANGCKFPGRWVNIGYCDFDNLVCHEGGSSSSGFEFRGVQTMTRGACGDVALNTVMIEAITQDPLKLTNCERFHAANVSIAGSQSNWTMGCGNSTFENVFVSNGSTNPPQIVITGSHNTLREISLTGGTSVAYGWDQIDDQGWDNKVLGVQYYSGSAGRNRFKHSLSRDPRERHVRDATSFLKGYVDPPFVSGNDLLVGALAISPTAVTEGVDYERITDTTNDLGLTLKVNGAGGFYTDLSSLNGERGNVVGQFLPKGRVRVYLKLKATTGGTQPWYLKYGSTTAGSATLTLTTSYQVLSFDADLRSAAVGDTIVLQSDGIGGGGAAPVYVAWVAFRVFDADLLLTNHLEGYEIADPTAPAANGGRLYFRDNGAGKTQLCVIFNTGAVQVIATQP